MVIYIITIKNIYVIKKKQLIQNTIAPNGQIYIANC